MFHPSIKTAMLNAFQQQDGKNHPILAVDAMIAAAEAKMVELQYLLLRSIPPEDDIRREFLLETKHFPGQTRVLGEEQGYRALPIQDIDTPGGPAMVSFHKINELDVAKLAQNHCIQLTVMGNKHPPIKLEVTPRPMITFNML